jgi:ABC-type oligopeptide transport system substrate-binding subunit/DNA-binding SARP family transcriptional activator
MPRMQLFLFGPPRLERDGAPLDLGRRKAMALLIYLTMNARCHSRDVLATLFWPRLDASRGRANLSRTLTVLKQFLGAEGLSANREIVALQPSDDLWTDALRFQQLLGLCSAHGHPARRVCAACLPLLGEAAALYDAEFLAGFTLRDSLPWDEWQLDQTEALRRQLGSALERLGRGYAVQSDWETAIHYVRRWVANDPLHEPAHRQLMSLYAHSGQRSAALRQYQVCADLLYRELGVAPQPETTALYERLTSSALFGAPLQISEPTPPLRGDGAPRVIDRPVFVGRERELGLLRTYLAEALEGRGRVVFLLGDAGCGKTMLLIEFAFRAQEAYRELIAVGGNCHASSGDGDPYLPFRDVLATLTGDLDDRMGTHLVAPEYAQRVWESFPDAARALVEHGPDLLDVFVASGPLASRVAAFTAGGAEWRKGLDGLLQRGDDESAARRQSQLNEQYSSVLRSLAARRPLLILLDDLQWADAASIGLLFQFGRRLAASGDRILVVGAYRPEEVALGHTAAAGREERHLLEKVVNEFKRTFGQIEINLAAGLESERRDFVDALLDTEPNRLGRAFRSTLFQRTRGHPLFTVELLRGMQQRGDLVRDAGGNWIEGNALDWRTLPARVEGVIEERIGRLEAELREVLSVASVEGQRFTLEVVAAALEMNDRELLRRLVRLQRQHHLVRESGAHQVDHRRLSSFQFAHFMFQDYLYQKLTDTEQRVWHGEIATALEGLYAGHTDEVAVPLARHYAEAGQQSKAAHYLLKSGDRAWRLYAYPKAIDYYEQALAIFKGQGDDQLAAQTLMKLGLIFHNTFDFRRARRAYDEGFTLWQRESRSALQTPPPPAPHPLRVSWRDPPTLDPSVAFDNESLGVVDQLFSGLVRQCPDMAVVPDVARTWEILENGQRYVFHLRDDVYWSDGTPVTAPDFEFAWRRALDPTTQSRGAALLYDVEGAWAFHRGTHSGSNSLGVHALNPRTLLVELERPTAYFPSLLASCPTYPLPRHVVEAHGPRWTDAANIVTNGPFHLKAWSPGESLILSRNLNYHGVFCGNLECIELSLRPDIPPNLDLYEGDRLDVLCLWSFSTPQRDRARRRQPDEYITIPALATLYAGFNTRRSPFDDLRVRQAFAMATDRSGLGEAVARGDSPAATGGFIPPGMPGHSAGIGLPYDPDRARQLLAEAGYPGGHGFPVVEASTVPYRAAREGVFLRRQWHEILGVEVTWTPLEWSPFLNRLVREPLDLFLISWTADYADPDDFMRTSAFRRYTGWQCQSYDRLVDRARHVMVQNQRIELYQQADRILADQVPIIPIAHPAWHLLVKPWVTRFPTSRLRWWAFWKDVVIDPH